MPLFKGCGCKSKPAKAIDYITNKKKAAIVTSYALDDHRDYARQFAETARLFGKAKKFDSRKYYHFKHSFDPKDNISPEEAHRLTEELAQQAFPDNEYIIATHTDKHHIHCHIIVNSVSFVNGKMLHYSNDEYGKLKDLSNEIAAKYGYSTLDFRKSSADRIKSEERQIVLKGGTSWKEELREVIAEAKQICNDMVFYDHTFINGGSQNVDNEMKPTKPFYKMPKVLFTDKYSKLSNDAKILYMMLLDRKSLSEKNDFYDENGNTVVLFSNLEVCRSVGCGHDKATAMFRELEKYKLIHRRRQGKGKPDLVYVSNEECEKSADWNAEKSHTCTRKFRADECGKTARIKIENNKIERSHIYQSINYHFVESQIKDQIEYDILTERYSEGVVSEIVSLLSESLCSDEETIRIGQRSVSRSTFNQRLSLLTAEHIEYVIEKLEKSQNKIHNMRAYMLTMLYNAIDTMDTEGIYGN